MSESLKSAVALASSVLKAAGAMTPDEYRAARPPRSASELALIEKNKRQKRALRQLNKAYVGWKAIQEQRIAGLERWNKQLVTAAADRIAAQRVRCRCWWCRARRLFS